MVVDEKQINASTTVFEGIPLLIIEVFSPGTKDFSLTEKLQWYQSAGVPEILFIDPTEQVVNHYRKVGKKYTQHQLESGSFSFNLVNDLEIHIDWFWMEIPPLLKDLPL